ncbi:MAG: hypothetical protein AAGE01_04800 [Pseudomonadota bacterium]
MGAPDRYNHDDDHDHGAGGSASVSLPIASPTAARDQRDPSHPTTLQRALRRVPMGRLGA